MIYENTGFYLDNNMKLREAARSIDTESRAAGIEALKPLVAGFGPDSADQNRIVKRFLQERDNESLIFTCGVCGVSNHESIAVTQVGEYWIDCKLRLTPQEVTGYKQSRVEGYTNITVLAEYALANAQSLHWAFHNLYEKEGATDKLFKDLCLASNVDNQIILFLVPQLINFSNHPHEKGNYENIGIMGICSSCNQELANNSRPEFSMCGKFQCNFGYPKYLDGLNINDLSVAELLAVSQARLYAHLVKCIKGSSVAKDDFLVALPYTHDRYGKNKVKFGTEASTSTIKYDKFNYDLGYAVTAYKLQGATLDNVLIDLNQRPQGLKAMDLRALYVILSRVATMEKIKIMPFRNHPQKRDINKNNFLNYLENLSQCAELSAWKDCIDPITHLFDPFLYNRPVKKSKRVKK